MEIRLTRSAYKNLLKTPSSFRKNIENKIESLLKDSAPPGSKSLTNRPGRRLRVGSYRILYVVDSKKKIITILGVGHRRDVYKDR